VGAGKHAAPRERIRSVDLVRGLVMVIMALDHTRDYFHASPYSPTDLQHVSAALFLTRLITHLCAPTFVFLAGAAASLSGAARRSRGELSRYLLVRGVWLILLEFTLVHFGWHLLSFDRYSLQVIWALGCSMVALAGLVWLPLPAIGAVGGAMVLLHNLLDRWEPVSAPLPAWLWSILHAPGPVSLGPDSTLFVLYPLVPWIGVMALGYVFGATLPTDASGRARRCLAWGAALLLLFAALRGSGLYGDPHPWAEPEGRAPLFTLLAFFNTEKYPPSLHFLLMTLGPMFLLLALGEVWHPTTAARRLYDALLLFGRVPLFFYLVHLPLIHGLARLDRLVRYGFREPPQDWRYSLPVVYGVWLLVVGVMYLLCVRYDTYKRAHPSGWTRYI
jgi:uncharacterized membrane protein